MPGTELSNHHVRLATAAMGTRFELVLPECAALSERDLRAAGESVLAIIEDCDARYSLFRRDSLLARINRSAFDGPVRLDEDMFELLATCAELRDATDGAFDIAVESWMRARGFRESVGGSSGARGTYELDEQSRSVRFTTANTALDLGGIAKGHALDLAAAQLRDFGLESAFLHGGTSSVIALGSLPEERAWRVALGPRDGAPIAELRDNALSVSAPRGRTVESAGESIGHILDPRDGRPAPLASFAAVVHESARTAEAWSTALLVLAARSPRTPHTPPALRYALRRDDDCGWTIHDQPPHCFELAELQPR